MLHMIMQISIESSEWNKDLVYDLWIYKTGMEIGSLKYKFDKKYLVYVARRDVLTFSS